MAEFLNGIFARRPNPKAPDFIKAKIVIKKQEFLQEIANINSEYINLELCESRNGKYYLRIDEYKKQEQEPEPNIEEFVQENNNYINNQTSSKISPFDLSDIEITEEDYPF